MGLKWLITGGCGFIGRNLVNNLLQKKDHYIRIIDNLKVGTREDLRQVCDFTETAPGNLQPPPTGPGKTRKNVELVAADIFDSDP